MIGRTIGGYKILSEIGRGGMGIVYKAEDKSGNICALKILPPELAYDEDFVRRFHREAQAASILSHPNIVRIIESGQEGGIHYLAMEYVEGKDCKRLIEEEGLSIPEIIRITKAICLALERIHREGIVHRDVKSRNILIGNDGSIKLSDFGIARGIDFGSVTGTGSTIGSPEYMSPEQVEGEKEIDKRSDIYSLGIVMYEMATGHVPFTGPNFVSVAHKHLHVDPTPPRKISFRIPKGLERIILKALAKRKEDRYQRIQDLLRDLEDFERLWNERSERMKAGEMVPRSLYPGIGFSGNGVCLVDPEYDLYIVAKGEGANHFLLEIWRQICGDPDSKLVAFDEAQMQRQLEWAIQIANKMAYERYVGRKGGISLVISASPGGGVAWIGRAGEGGAFLVRGNEIRSLTRDESSPLGISPLLEIGIVSVEFLPGDSIFICQEMEKKIGETEIKDIIRRSGYDPQQVCDEINRIGRNRSVGEGVCVLFKGEGEEEDLALTRTKQVVERAPSEEIQMAVPVKPHVQEIPAKKRRLWVIWIIGSILAIGTAFISAYAVLITGNYGKFYVKASETGEIVISQAPPIPLLKEVIRDRTGLVKEDVDELAGSIISSEILWESLRKGREFSSMEDAKAYVARAFFHDLAKRRMGSSRESDLRMAAEYLRKAMDYDPSIPGIKEERIEVHHKLGTIHYREGRMEKAISEFREALDLRPSPRKGAEIYNDLGNAYISEGMLDEAVVAFKEAVRLSPNEPRYHFNLGSVYEKQGRFSEAANEYQKALDIDPLFPGAEEALNRIKEFLETEQPKQEQE